MKILLDVGWSLESLIASNLILGLTFLDEDLNLLTSKDLDLLACSRLIFAEISFIMKILRI